MALISYWLFVVAFPQLIGLVGCAVPTHLKAELLRTLAALARYFQWRKSTPWIEVAPKYSVSSEAQAE